MLCCGCVMVWRQWLALGGNKYAAKEIEHKDGKWCPDAIKPIVDFAEGYAARSGVTVQWLHKNGREVRTCDCGDFDCEGLQMAHIEKKPQWERDLEENDNYYPDYTPAYPKWWEAKP